MARTKKKTQPKKKTETTLPAPSRAPRPDPAPGPAPAPAPAPTPEAAPATPAREKRTAGELARGQREISVSEFFAKNRHLLGFDSPAKALLTAVKEAVDNALDACEEAGILPSIRVEIAEVEPNARYRLAVLDNGPGIVKAQVPRIFGKLLYGSKFHRLRQSLAADQPVLVERRGRAEWVPIGALVDPLLAPGEEVCETGALGLRALAFDPADGTYDWRPISHAIRHERANEVLDVRAEGGKRVLVTGCHSLFTAGAAAGEVRAVEARALRPGDVVVAPARRPLRAPLDLVRVEAVLPAADLAAPPGREGDDPHRFVYDLSVPGCENFVAGEGGLACHNSRGQQGIGISAAGLYGLLTTGKPIVITSRTGKGKRAHHFELAIDTRRNEPNVIVDTIVPDWPVEHGTRVEIELAGAYKAGRRSVDEYIEQTALANPHAEIVYEPPRGHARIHLPRVDERLPPEPEEIRPHPHGVELGLFMRMLHDARPRRSVSNVLTRDFSRVSGKNASALCAAAGLSPRTRARDLAPADVQRLHAAIQAAKLVGPSTRSVVPIGEDLIRKGLEREAPRAALYVTRTRPPRVYRGNPFQVEVGLAYGGELTGVLEHVGAAATEGIWIAGIALDPERRVDQGLLAVPGMTRAKIREICHRAHVDPPARARALSADELERLRHALEADLRADAASRPIELVRLANRVPLLYQQSACATTQAVIDTNWRRYGLAQARGGLPTGPLVLVVHIASVWVPFTSESKEAIAHYPEIVEEVQRALKECGRQLGAWLNKRALAKVQAARRDKIALYAGELVEALHALTGRPRERIGAAIEAAKRRHLKIEDAVEERDVGEGEAEEGRPEDGGEDAGEGEGRGEGRGEGGDEGEGEGR